MSEPSFPPETPRRLMILHQVLFQLEDVTTAAAFHAEKEGYLTDVDKLEDLICTIREYKEWSASRRVEIRHEQG